MTARPARGRRSGPHAAAPPPPRAGRALTVLMALLTAGGTLAIAYLGRHWDLFFYDEWGTILYRRAGGLDAFLAPHNGHLQAVVVAVYRAGFATIGLDPYWPYRAALLAAHAGLVWLVFAHLRERVQPALAVCGAALILLLGHAWEVLFWPINLGFVVPLIALLAILRVWERRGRRWGALRAGLGLAALASSGLGVPVAAGLAARAALERDRRRLLEVALPALAYAIWYLAYRPGATTPASLRAVPGADPRGDLGVESSAASLSAVPGYAVDAAAAGVNGLFALGPRAGLWALAALAALALATAIRRPGARRPALVFLVVLGSFWLALAATRSGLQDPGASRYVYPSAVLMVLLAGELLRGVVLPRAATATLVVGTLLVLRADVAGLDRIGRAAEGVFDAQRRELRALARYGAGRPPGYQPDPVRMPGVAAGPYAAAVRALGHPPGAAP